MLLVLAPPHSPKAEPGAGGTLPIEGQVILEAREKQRPSKAKYGYHFTGAVLWGLASAQFRT